MKKELLFSGIGGQGIMNLGEILCAAAIKAGYNVTFSPVYGAEKRGGRTMCNIVMSTEIECQIVSEADVMLIMDEASLADYQHLAGEQGVLILSAQVESTPDSPCKNIKTVPFIEKAMELGNAKVANMIALGFVLKYLDFIPYTSVENLVKETFASKAKLIPLNLEALKTGYEYEA
ncbi:2-oxoglutarate ferredoxin oxidoreductase subunit gamma [Oscillibacter sp. PC13]|uniref:2-oxoacid:acceptor oxidoreductase family protein n=1 Tax=Oscillibacter sp. PC13 TaxID=1855299 RepID=UPI0008F01768|nr:2-oxoacid:acceptor oxidoreductase family protein [Oscillibacter sp. PC13]SFQ20253.1 2-oxoglutarate ferredoxin oxidoreductase subunit gamma [Oscillibacter sp. PC13]